MSLTSRPDCTNLSHPSWDRPLVLYQSERLNAYGERLIHAFTGKPLTFGGAAAPRDMVLKNRSALCEALNLDPERLIVPSQTHSATIRTNRESAFEETDAVILLEPKTPVLLMFADCTPVLLYDPVQHLGAVIHAGWRGTAQQIAVKTAQRLQDEYGSKAEDLMGCIGPAIGRCCYEVSADVVEALSLTTQAPLETFVHHPNQKAHVDLQALNRQQLQDVGVFQVEILDACTRCSEDHLWSHRRGEAGRQGALMALL